MRKNLKRYSFRKEKDFGILFDKREGEYYYLNETASEILDMLLKGYSLEDVCKHLEKIFYDVDYASVKKFFEKFSSIKEDIDYLFCCNSPLYVQFYPTLRCNQRCSFCYLKMFNSLQSSSMSRSITNEKFEVSLKNAVKIIKELREHGVFELDILGGEPFLHKDIYDIVEYAVNSGMLVNISTNGSYLERIKKVSELDNVNIGISLHGSKESIHDSFCGRGSFKRCIDVLEELGDRVFVKTVVNKKNFFDVENIVKMLCEKGIKKYFLIQMIDPEDKESLSLNEFYEVYKRALKASEGRIEVGIVGQLTHIYYDLRNYKLITKTFCKAGSVKMVVFPNGDVYPCTMFLDYKVGNILNEGFESVWRSSRWSIFRNLRRVCSFDCVYNHVCKGGCLGFIIKQKRENKRLEPDKRCPYYKIVYYS